MPIRIFRCSLLFLLVVLNSTFIVSQDQPPVSDPKAVALATQAISSLTNGVAVSDVTLNGDATWIAGSDKETGPATLLAKGTGESRIDLKLSGGARTEIRNDSTELFPQGESISSDGTVQRWPQHNCWINASWFFPALSILAAPSDPSAGQNGGLLGINAAVGQGGTFDVQRERSILTSTTTFYSGYTQAANIAVGAYEYGAKLSPAEANFLANAYADVMSSNAGDPELTLYQNLGYDLAAAGWSPSCH